jgi:hypothetical protein
LSTGKVLDQGCRLSTQSVVSSTTRRDEQELRDEHFAMRLSLIFGVAMLVGKSTAYFMTAFGGYFF